MTLLQSPHLQGGLFQGLTLHSRREGRLRVYVALNAKSDDEEQNHTAVWATCVPLFLVL